jgi:hypothetical protein
MLSTSSMTSNFGGTSFFATKANPPSGGKVAVTFILNSDGEVMQVSKVDSTSTKAGADVCVRSITENARYGPWTKNMKQALGSQQTITFTFSYQ